MVNQRSNGKVVGIYIASRRGDPTQPREQIHVLAGRGIEGDRYFHSPEDQPDRTGTQITFIEQETIDAMCRDGVEISPDQTRRNIVTQGVALNELVGKKFSVGNIQLRGIRLCEPCDYLASRTHPQVKQSMAHRGGLRADILADGYIHLNDTITTSHKEST